jgi:glycine hydroxymethyltransferase
MSLADGGHLTHGASVNFSGRIYHSVQYGLDANSGLIDYNEVAKLARAHKPKLIITGFSAYSRVVNWDFFREIADEIGAFMISDIAHVAGLVAVGLYPSPVGIADVTTTTTHKTLRGPRSGLIMARSNPKIEKKLNSAVFPGTQGGPLMHVIAGKAVAFKEAMMSDFRAYQQQVLVNAQVMAQTFIDRSYKVVSGGTDNHLFLVDLVGKEITGKQADALLGDAHLTVNKNAVPNDPLSPFVTSGIRVGTPAITTRGFRETEARIIAGWMCDILDNPTSEKVAVDVRHKVEELCSSFPVYVK